MKKTLYYIGAAVLILGALYIIEQWTSPQAGFFGVGKKWYNPETDATPTANVNGTPKAYPTLKTQVMLYKGQTLYPTETEVLQKFINVFPGVQPVPVTGVFDELTENAVKQVTGKGVTNIEEFQFVWMTQKQLGDIAHKIIKGEL